MQKELTKYQIIYKACIEANQARMRANLRVWDKETMLMYPKYYCSFKALDVETEAVKDITSYLRRHHKKMGLVPLHTPGEYARYVFNDDVLVDSLIDDVFAEAKGQQISNHTQEEQLIMTSTVEGASTMKPLFVPLNTEYYEAFKAGTKHEELRIYSIRWNENTCLIGRKVVLSKGYGKQNRLTGRIWKFKKQHGSTFGSTYKEAITKVYGTLDVYIACISIADIEPIKDNK